MITLTPIKLQRLREIINEEVAACATMVEFVDHKGISDVVAIASKLLDAMESFKEKAPPAAINAVTPHFSEMEKVLENMVSSPGSYVSAPVKEPQHVSFKAVKS